TNSEKLKTAWMKCNFLSRLITKDAVSEKAKKSAVESSEQIRRKPYLGNIQINTQKALEAKQSVDLITLKSQLAIHDHRRLITYVVVTTTKRAAVATADAE
ncbi:hypothetical protein LSAT2_030453, partial [Lamellibrachia satsuma]